MRHCSNKQLLWVISELSALLGKTCLFKEKWTNGGKNLSLYNCCCLVWLVVFLWNTEADLVVGLHQQGCHKKRRSMHEMQRWKHATEFGYCENTTEPPWRTAGVWCCSSCLAHCMGGESPCEPCSCRSVPCADPHLLPCLLAAFELTQLGSGRIKERWLWQEVWEQWGSPGKAVNPFLGVRPSGEGSFPSTWHGPGLRALWGKDVRARALGPLFLVAPCFPLIHWVSVSRPVVCLGLIAKLKHITQVFCLSQKWYTRWRIKTYRPS